MPQRDEELNPTIPGTRAHQQRTARTQGPPPRRAGALPFLLPCRYEFREIIGRGGMGLVARVYDSELEREVALKAVLPGRTSPTALKRFITEARTMARLEHPAIMPVHDAGTAEDGSFWYTMKLLSGGSLRDRLRAHGSKQTAFPLKERVSIVARVAEALGYMHSRHVVHRDMKPDNVMLSGWGEILITDFGIARLLEGPDDADSASIIDEQDLAAEPVRTMEGSVLGTPAYMPPEQARGKQALIGPWTDIWALGAILYEMLTGEPPYKARDVMDVLRQARAGRVEDPRMRARRTGAPPVPPELVSIAQKAMALQPNRRYRTADALRADLSAWLGFDPVAAHRDTLAQKAARYVRRHPAKTVAIGAAALFAVGVGAIVAFAQSAVSQADAERAREAERASVAQAEATQRAAEAQRHAAEAERQRVRAALESGKVEDLQRDLGIRVSYERDAVVDEVNQIFVRALEQGGGTAANRALAALPNEKVEAFIAAVHRTVETERKTGRQLLNGKDIWLLGLIYKQTLGQPERAIPHYRESLRRDPGNWGVRMSLGCALADAPDKQVVPQTEALQELERAAREASGPQASDAWFNLGVVQARNAMFRESRLNMEKALSLDPPAGLLREIHKLLEWLAQRGH